MARGLKFEIQIEDGKCVLFGKISGLQYTRFCDDSTRKSENQKFACGKTKTHINCAVTGQLISIFIFATQIVQLLFFLNPRFQSSGLLL